MDDKTDMAAYWTARAAVRRAQAAEAEAKTEENADALAAEHDEQA